MADDPLKLKIDSDVDQLLKKFQEVYKVNEQTLALQRQQGEQQRRNREQLEAELKAANALASVLNPTLGAAVRQEATLGSIFQTKQTAEATKARTMPTSYGDVLKEAKHGAMMGMAVEQEQKLLAMKLARDPDVLALRVAQEKTLAKERLKVEGAYLAAGLVSPFGGGAGGGGGGPPTGGKGGKKPQSWLGMFMETMGDVGAMAGGAAKKVLPHISPMQINVVIGWVSNLATSLTGLASIPLQVVGSGLEFISTSLHAIQGPLGPLGIGFAALNVTLGTTAKIIESIPIIGTVLSPLLDSIVGLPRILEDITTTMVSLSKVASPGQFHMWEVALTNFQGVIGRTFLPVLEMMREGVRLLGDTMANILPDSEEVRGAMSEFRQAFAQMGKEWREMLREVGPMIREVLIDAIRQLSHWLAVAARATMMWVSALRGVFGGRASGIWSWLNRRGDLRSQEGAGAQPAAMTSLSEYGKQLQLAAFREPGRMTWQGEMKRIALDMKKIDEDALKLYNTMAKFWEDTGNFLKNNWHSVKGIIPKLDEIFLWARQIWAVASGVGIGTKEAAASVAKSGGLLPWTSMYNFGKWWAGEHKKLEQQKQAYIAENKAKILATGRGVAIAASVPHP
jgi:hypothetical protein